MAAFPLAKIEPGAYRGQVRVHVDASLLEDARDVLSYSLAEFGVEVHRIGTYLLVTP